MPTLTKADAQVARLQVDTPSTLTNLADLEWNFYSSQSNLTPASKFSISDHKLAYYQLQGSFSGSLNDIELAYFKSQGAVGSSRNDIALDFFTNRQFFLPSALANLELWLEADNISGAVLASDGFDRSKNLLAANDPGNEVGVGWGISGGGVITPSNDTVVFHPGGGVQSRKAIVDGSVSGQGISTSVATLPIGYSGPTTGSAWVNAPAATLMSLEIAQRDAGGALIHSLQIPFTGTGAWQRVVGTLTWLTDSPKVNLKVTTATAVAVTFNVDDVQLEAGSKATAFVWGDATHLGTTDQGVPWTVALGSAGIVSGKAQQITDFVSFIDTGTPDTDVSAIAYGTNPGIIFRVQDANNYYLLNNGGFWKNIAGAFTSLSFTTGALGVVNNGDNICVVSMGTTHVIYVNGQQRGTIVDATFPAGTKQGIRLVTGNTSQVSNFSVKTPIYSDGAALPVWPDKSGYARHALQTTVAKQPLFRNAKPNLFSYAFATAEVDTTPYVLIANVGLSRSTAQAKSGSASLALTSAAAGDMQAGGHPATASTLVPVQPNTSYTFMIASRAETVPRSCAVRVRWADGTQTAAGSVDSAFTPNSTTGWTVHTVTATSPANAAFGTCDLLVPATAAAGEVHYADEFGMFLGAGPASWLPPVSLPNSKPTVQFDGVDDSFSTQGLLGSTFGSVFLVFRKDGSKPGAADSTLFTDGAPIGLWVATGSDKPYIYDGTTFVNFNASLDSNAHDLELVLTATTIATYQDGSGNTNGSFTRTKFNTNPMIGASGATNGPLGSIVAVVVFSRVLSTIERQQVERYLRNKYALS